MQIDKFFFTHSGKLDAKCSKKYQVTDLSSKLKSAFFKENWFDMVRK